MIKIRGSDFCLSSPSEFSTFKDQNLTELRKLEEQDKVYFVLPERIKDIAESDQDTNNILQAYKVGFLKFFLSNLYPEKKQPEIYYIIKYKYQMFYSERKLNLAYTYYRKRKYIFW